MYMLRGAPGNSFTPQSIPDQLFNLTEDPEERNNLAAIHPLAISMRQEVEAKFDIPRIQAAVLQSQQARLMMFEAMKKGSLFPWDFQPLRKASNSTPAIT